MTPRLTCPHARYISEMRIFCDAANDLCGNVYFKTCKGWWVLTAGADRCPLRRRQNGKADGTAESPASGGNH